MPRTFVLCLVLDSMIPKIIHYVWLGESGMPAAMQKCVDSWRKQMPDYEVRCWGNSEAGAIGCRFIDEAIAEKKWAFASDVVRLFALYHHGGIYLDTDVLVYRPFDPLLMQRAFIGVENSIHIINRRTMRFLTTCCMGAEPHHEFLARCLDYYRGRRFITCDDPTMPPDLRLDLRLNSEVICRLAREIGYNPSALKNEIQRCGSLTVYPSEYFDPQGTTRDSFSRHLAIGTWRHIPKKEEKYTFTYKIKWRLWAVVEKVLRRFGRKTIELN